MSNFAANEGTTFTLAALSALQVAAAPGGPSNASAELYYLCGQLSAQTNTLIDVPIATLPTSAFWTQLIACFEQSRIAGATYETMDTVRALCLSFFPATNLGAAVSNFINRLALSEQAQILAAMTFTSRVQIDNYLDQINANFGVAIDVAANNGDNVCFLALIALNSAVVQDLATRAAPLPEIVNVVYPISFPVLYIAQRLYQDPTQAAALIAMNGIAHPAFCPLNMEVLSLGTG